MSVGLLVAVTELSERHMKTLGRLSYCESISGRGQSEPGGPQVGSECVLCARVCQSPHTKQNLSSSPTSGHCFIISSRGRRFETEQREANKLMTHKLCETGIDKRADAVVRKRVLTNGL